MHDLRLQIFSHIQTLHVGYFDKNPVGRIITRITTDVDVLNELFTAGVVSIFGDIFLLAGIVGVMLWLDWKLALVCFSVLPLLVLATAVFKLKVRGSYRWVRTCIARINAFLQENITGMSVVQLFVQEERKFKEFEERNRDHLNANLKSIFYYALFYPVVSLIGSLAVALILWYGGAQIIQNTLTLGVLVAFIQYSDRFFKPISDLSEKFNILLNAMVSSERIFRLLDTQPAVQPPSHPLSPSVIQGRIEFKDISFHYKEGDSRPEQCEPHYRSRREGSHSRTDRLPESPRLSTSSAASTMSRPEEILIDGVDVRKMDLEKLRQLTSVVLQDVFLFSGTIEENIRLWQRDIDRQQVESAAKFVNASRFVERMPKGLDSHVAERGSSLSVGQRQLLAFARAVAHDPKVLVLDEATSSVDTDTELLIQDALDKLLRNRTALIIAHRLSTIQNCDRIVVLSKGQIREEGSHDELLKHRGIYYMLYPASVQGTAGTSGPRPAGRGHRIQSTRLQLRVTSKFACSIFSGLAFIGCPLQNQGKRLNHKPQNTEHANSEGGRSDEASPWELSARPSPLQDGRVWSFSRIIRSNPSDHWSM